MDNKRTFLAIGISFLILVVYQYFFPQTPHLPPAGQQPVATRPAQNSPETKASAEVQTAALTAEAGGEFLEAYKKQQADKTLRPVTVRTDLYTLTISNKGGVITSWGLNDYKNKDGSLVELVSEDSVKQGFYPLSLKFNDQQVTRRVNNSFYEADKYNLTLDPSRPEGKVSLSYTDPSGVKIIKELKFSNQNYYVTVNVKQRNLGTEPVPGDYYLTWGYNFGRQKKNSQYHYTGPSTFIDGELVEDTPKGALSCSAPKEVKDFKIVHKGNISWSTLQDGYFASIIIPQTVASEIVVAKEDGKLSMGIASSPEPIKPGSEVVNSFGIYAGPKKMESLQVLNMNLDKIIDYGWFDVLAKPMMQLLNFFNSYTGNYGWDIILVTILIKILFYPLTTASFKSMRQMQKVQPKMANLRKKYKDDPQKLNQEIMTLYKKHKVNPLGGCMPMILQIPVFFALYKALLMSIELRHAPFMLWLTDLSAKDPYYITPVLMGVSMFVQQKMTPSSADPNQAKIMLFMPIIFTVMFLNFPSGLVIYWLLNNILGIGQQYLINKQEEAKEAIV